MGHLCTNTKAVSLWPLNEDWKSSRTTKLEIPGTHRIFHSTAYLGHPACVKNLAKGHGQYDRRYGWTALCPGKALAPHLSAEVDPRASYKDVFGLSLQLEPFC